MSADFQFEPSWRAGASGAARRHPTLGLERPRALHDRHVPRAGIPERSPDHRLERAGHGCRAVRGRAAGLLRDRQHAAAGPESDPAGRRRPGRGLLDCPAGGRRLQLLPVDDRAHRTLRTVPGRPPGPHAEGAAARPRRRCHRCFRAAGLGLRVPRCLRRASAAGLQADQRVLRGAAHVLRGPARSPARPARRTRAPPGRASACRCGKCRTTPKTSAAQSNGIFLRILAHALLGAEERAEWRALSGTVRRRREWLFGRAAVKEAVRMALFQQTGKLLYPSDITVLHDELGAPFVDGWWRGDAGRRAAGVAVAHGARLPGGGRRGRVAGRRRLRGPRPHPAARAHRRDAHAAERAAIEGLAGAALDERLLRLWCAKEAAAKFLGVGLQGQPEAFEVQFVDDACARARVVFETATTEVRDRARRRCR